MTIDELAVKIDKSYPHSKACSFPDDSPHREFIYEIAQGLLPQLGKIVEVKEP